MTEQEALREYVATEIQLLGSGYSAHCSARGCRARATMLARYTDGQGRQLEATRAMRSTRGLARFERRTPMPDRTIKRWLQDCDAALASDDGPIFSTVAKLVDALKRSIPEGTQNAERKRKPCA